MALAGHHPPVPHAPSQGSKSGEFVPKGTISTNPQATIRSTIMVLWKEVKGDPAKLKQFDGDSGIKVEEPTVLNLMKQKKNRHDKSYMHKMWGKTGTQRR